MTIPNAMAIATIKIAEIIGKDYFRENYENSIKTELVNPKNDYPYFIGFEGDNEKNLWTVFAYVNVDRATESVTILDYRLPDGTRMENPIKPVRCA